MLAPSSTVKTWIIEPCAMSSDFPLSVKPRNFCFFLSQQGGRGCVFAVFFAPIPEQGIPDFIAHGSIIRVLRYCHPAYHWGISTTNTSDRPSWNT